MDLHGRIALITGASSGIGYATALRMAEVGADIAIGYARKEQAARVLSEHIHQMGQRALPVRADLSKPAQVQELVDVTEAQLGPIDILISNAGMGNRRRLEELTLEEWDETMQVNLRAAFMLAAGLLGLTHSLSASLAPHGVTVNAVAPALIADTGMLPGTESELVARIPVGRLGKPEDVVEVIMMLVVNSYMTNQTLLVDGGMYPH